MHHASANPHKGVRRDEPSVETNREDSDRQAMARCRVPTADEASVGRGLDCVHAVQHGRFGEPGERAQAIAGARLATSSVPFPVNPVRLGYAHRQPTGVTPRVTRAPKVQPRGRKGDVPD